LLEGLVFGARAANAMAAPLRQAELQASRVIGWRDDTRLQPNCGVPTADAVRDLMWRCCGLIRTGIGLQHAVSQLDAWRAAMLTTAPAPSDDEVRRTRTIVTAGLMIARAALRREESRGGHFRSDFPHRDDIKWRKHIADRLAGA
jgi:L-aspartate oxidase